MPTKRVTRVITEERFHPPVDSSSTNLSALSGAATVTAAATGAGVHYVVTRAVFSYSFSSTAVSATTVACNIIDGATGGTVYLWRAVASVTTGCIGIIDTGPLNIAGSPNVALTAEFSAGVTNVTQAVTMTYHTIGPN